MVALVGAPVVFPRAAGAWIARHGLWIFHLVLVASFAPRATGLCAKQPIRLARFGPEQARLPYPFSFSQTKPSDTIRIFALGESAAKGDPDPQFGISRMLQTMLTLRHPAVRFEVVNTAMTAINSHVILPIARDLTAAQGDVWVIYMGNNEVVGPFGAGTVFGPQSPPLPLIRSALALKATRTGELLDSILQRARNSRGKEG